MLLQSRFKQGYWLYSSICSTISLLSTPVSHHPHKIQKYLSGCFHVHVSKQSKAVNQKQTEEEINLVVSLLSLLSCDTVRFYLSFFKTQMVLNFKGTQHLFETETYCWDIHTTHSWWLWMKYELMHLSHIKARRLQPKSGHHSVRFYVLCDTDLNNSNRVREIPSMWVSSQHSFSFRTILSIIAQCMTSIHAAVITIV